MLPSKGYFKALECPYFTESFCDRPYCHFKHSKQDFLSDSNCQITKMDNCDVISSDDSKLPEEPTLKPKVKSKIIEYVPQYIKSMNLESYENSCIYGSSNEVCKNEPPILEYIPSCVNETNLDFKLETLNDNNKLLKEKKQTEPVNFTEDLTKTYNMSKQNSDVSEYVPIIIEKPIDIKTNTHKDSHHREHRSSSKRKHESSRKSSRSSSKSSNKSKKSKRDKSPECKKDKNKRDHEKKREKEIQKEKKITKLDTFTSNSYGPKSLKEAVMEKVKKKLVELDSVKTDLSCSSDEGNGPSTTSIESDLIEYSSSEDSSSEQKPCNVVEAKLKKRISHISPSSIFSKMNVRNVVKPRSSKSLHEIVASRVQSIQNSDSRLPKKTEISFYNDPNLPLLKAKSRVAHQPKIEPVTTESLTSNNSKVNNKEITAGIKLCLRIKSFKSSNNMPNPLRQSCLEKLFTAFMNHYSSEEAIDKAHMTEEEVHNKAKSSGIYRNLIVQSLMKANKSPELQIKSNPYYPSHMYGVCLYDLIKKYILSKDELEKNGYPLMGDNNLAYISKNAYYYRPISKKRNGDKFVCMNCKNEFEINKRGMPIVTLSKCIYHSGKLKYERSKNEKFWLCCYKRQHESGCESSMFHVPDKLDDDALENFVVIENIKSNKNIEDPNFYALDCEMVNTTVGIEIVRVTVINHEGKEVYESKVKPSNPILDYKSKYSGITEESLKYCSKRLFDVQLDLMKIFDKESILIGHSLDSDLKALKMVHYNVVDTSIIYPHKYGPPYKWGLKFLCEQHLQRIIQSEEGHDSKEDALASLDLVWKKLKEDVKKFKPVNIISIDKR